MGKPDIDGFEEMEGTTFWKPTKVNEEISGVVIGIDEGQYGKNYTIKQDDGKMVTPSSYKVLQSRMATVRPGDTVKIIYTGTEPSKQRGYEDTLMFRVLVKRR